MDQHTNLKIDRVKKGTYIDLLETPNCHLRSLDFFFHKEKVIYQWKMTKWADAFMHIYHLTNSYIHPKTNHPQDRTTKSATSKEEELNLPLSPPPRKRKSWWNCISSTAEEFQHSQKLFVAFSTSAPKHYMRYNHAWPSSSSSSSSWWRDFCLSLG